jgi:hypothetical protein
LHRAALQSRARILNGVTSEVKTAHFDAIFDRRIGGDSTRCREQNPQAAHGYNIISQHWHPAISASHRARTRSGCTVR